MNLDRPWSGINDLRPLLAKVDDSVKSLESLYDVLKLFWVNWVIHIKFSRVMQFLKL